MFPHAIIRLIRKRTQENRPKLQLPRSQFELSLEFLAVAGLVVMVLYLLVVWGNLPERVPVHFNFKGVPDSWGDKGTLLIPVFVCCFIYLLLTIISRFPHTFNYLWAITESNAAAQYRLARTMLVALKAEIIWMFFFLLRATIEIGRGDNSGLGIFWVPLFLAVIFGTIAVYFIMAYSAR